MTQAAVEALSRLGVLPTAANPDVAKLKRAEELLAEVRRPISDDDARVLVKLFASDDSFGLAWTLVHLIETAPGWPLDDCLTDLNNDWIRHLKGAAS